MCDWVYEIYVTVAKFEIYFLKNVSCVVPLLPAAVCCAGFNKPGQLP